MTDDEIIEEICERAIKLAALKTEPLTLTNDSGRRGFRFGDWAFDLRRCVPKFWSFSGPKFGDIEMLRIHLAANSGEAPFYYSPDQNFPVIQNRELCDVMLLALRHSMILDDLAQIPVNDPKVDAGFDRF